MRTDPISRRSSTTEAVVPLGTTETGTQTEPLIDIEEVARRLGVPVRHVRRLVAERRSHT